MREYVLHAPGKSGFYVGRVPKCWKNIRSHDENKCGIAFQLENVNCPRCLKLMRPAPQGPASTQEKT